MKASVDAYAVSRSNTDATETPGTEPVLNADDNPGPLAVDQD